MSDFNVPIIPNGNPPDDYFGMRRITELESESDPAHANFGQGLANLFTGNLDYQRELSSLAKTNAYNVSLAKMNNAFTAEQAAITRDYNAVEAQKQRDWETYMSNSAYQRQAADLKAAGYNPALVLGLGGASTPSGAVASAQTAHASGAASPHGYSGHAGRGFDMLINGIVSLISRGFVAGVSASAYSERSALQNEASLARNLSNERIAASRNQSYDYRTTQWKKPSLATYYLNYLNRGRD